MGIPKFHIEATPNPKAILALWLGDERHGQWKPHPHIVEGAFSEIANRRQGHPTPILPVAEAGVY